MFSRLIDSFPKAKIVPLFLFEPSLFTHLPAHFSPLPLRENYNIRDIASTTAISIQETNIKPKILNVLSQLSRYQSHEYPKKKKKGFSVSRNHLSSIDTLNESKQRNAIKCDVSTFLDIFDICSYVMLFSFQNQLCTFLS